MAPSEAGCDLRRVHGREGAPSRTIHLAIHWLLNIFSNTWETLVSEIGEATACILFNLSTPTSGLKCQIQGKLESEPLIPRLVVSITAFICAGALALMGLLGPVGTGDDTVQNLSV